MAGYEPYPEVTSDGMPPHWPIKRLRFGIKMNPSKQELDLKPDELVSFVPMEAVGELGGIRTDMDKELCDIGSGYTYFCDDDVVVAKITPCFENHKGALAKGLTNGTAFGTTELHVLRADADQLSPAFLFYLTICDRFRKLGESEMYGAGGQKRVPETFIKDFRVGLPSLSEQQAITRFLDHKTKQIDDLIAKKQALLDKLAEKRVALATQAITEGLNELAERNDSGVPWLSRMPTHWGFKRLRFLTTMDGGMTPSTGNAEYWDGDIPWVSPKDMKRERLHAVPDNLTAKALQDTGIRLHDSGRVLIVVRGMILAHTFPVAINDVPVTINQDMKALSPVLDPDYLALVLRGLESVVLSIVEESAHGTKVLRTDLFKNLVLPVPPMEEQRDIVRAVQTLTQESDKMARAISSAISKLQEYRSSLITHAVTGQIDVRHVPIPEPAHA